MWRLAPTALAPVTWKDACRELGLAFESRLIEGARVQLKRLVARGWLIEPVPGKFAVAVPVALEAGA